MNAINNENTSTLTSNEKLTINKTETEISRSQNNNKIINEEKGNKNIPENIYIKKNEEIVKKDNRWFFENIMRKLSLKKAQTLSITIFLILRENKYQQMTMDELLNKIYEKFKADPHSIVKYKSTKGHFMSELQIKNGFYAAIRENMGLKTTIKNKVIYINVDFDGTVEYFKNLKIRHASQGILDESDVRYLFPDIKEVTLTGKKRLRRYYETAPTRKRKNGYINPEINSNINDYFNNDDFNNSIENDQNINSNKTPIFRHFKKLREMKEKNSPSIISIINSISPFKQDQLIADLPSIINDIKFQLKNFTDFSTEIQNTLSKIGKTVENQLKLKNNKNLIDNQNSNDYNESELFEKNKNILDKICYNLELEIKNFKNIIKNEKYLKNDELYQGHKKIIKKYNDLYSNSLKILCEIVNNIKNSVLDKETFELVNKVKEINSSLNEKGFYLENLNRFVGNYNNIEEINNRNGEDIKNITTDDIKNYYQDKIDKLMKEINDKLK